MQVGVKPENLRANKCSATTRLRLCDLRSASGGNSSSSNASDAMSGLGTASVESGGWGSTFSSNTGSSPCRWEDLNAIRGGQLVGDSTLSEGDLLLLHDFSQPLKQLSAATEALVGAADPRRGSTIGGGGVGSSWSARRGGAADTSATDGCDMASVGSWYEGGAGDSGKGGGDGASASSSTSTAITPLMLPANKPASGYNFKPKERALRIRTRRDRLQEGKITAAAAVAAAAATAAAAAAAAASITVAAAAAAAAAAVASSSPGDSIARDGPNAEAQPGEILSAGVGSSSTGPIATSTAVVANSSDALPTKSAAVVPAGTNGIVDGGGGGGSRLGSPGALSDVTLVGGVDTDALSSSEDTIGTLIPAGGEGFIERRGDTGAGIDEGEDGDRGQGLGGILLEDGCFEDLWGLSEEDNDTSGEVEEFHFRDR